MKIAILINRKVSESELLEINNLIQQNSDLKVYTTSNIQLPFPVNMVEQDAGEKRRINYDEMAGLLAFGEAGTQGVSFSEKLTINGMSLWHYHKFRVYFILRNLAYEAEMVRDFSRRFEKVILFSNGPDLEILTSLPRNIELRYHYSSGRKSKELLSRVRYIIYLKIRFVQGMITAFKARRVKHLLIDRSERQPCLDLKTLEIKPENYNLAYVFAKAGSDFAVIDEIETPKFEVGKPFHFRKWMFVNSRKPLLRIPGEYILLKALFTPAVWKKFLKAKKEYNVAITELRMACKTGREAWILNRLHQFHHATRLYLFKNFAYHRFFNCGKYQTVTSIDENSPAVRCILDAAKACNIKTIGIQHGNIHDLHPAYMFTLSDVKRGLLCDTTIVWGEYWKDFLISRANYSAGNLIIAGQSRTDIIPALLMEQQNLKQRLNLPEGKIIVFASQLQQDPLLRERAAFDVFQAVKNFRDVHLIIKLHPSEASDSGYYIRIAEQVGCLNYSITNDVDLYMLIAACRMLITCFSTVGAETVYFGKPLIILDHLDQDIQRYIRQRVAFKATSAMELIDVISGILAGELRKDENADNDFITRNAFRIDGLTSERIIEIIRRNH